MDGDDGATAIVLVLEGDVEVVVARVVVVRAELGLVDALARLHLAARRRGGAIRVRNSGEELGRLLDLVGLGGLAADGAGLVLEAGWQREGGEQRGVEEVVEPRDPSA